MSQQEVIAHNSPNPQQSGTSTANVGVHTLSAAHQFPEMKNTRILQAIRGEKPDSTPIWIMRQAGRYLPEFREFRQTHSFLDICKTPELACEVTLMPMKRFDFDASIIFSDIMVVPEALGMPVVMNPGPTFPQPLTLENIDEILKPEGAINRLKYVADAITLTRKRLEGKAVMFGFSGAPWTLMSYMIEGGGSKTYNNAKKWLYSQRKAAEKVIDILTYTIADYCIMQAQAGAQVIQIFDTNAEQLNKEIYEEFFIYPLKIIRERVKTILKKEGHPEVPMVIFAKGAMHSIEEFAKIGYDVIGLDWQTDPAYIRDRIPKTICLQGNLDPCALFSPKEELRDRVHKMMAKFEGFNYIVNLGHGITPDAPLESVYTFIEAVRSYRPPRNSPKPVGKI